MSAALEFLELARERRFDGSRLRALRDLLGGLGSVFGGFGLATIDDPSDLTALAERFIPFLKTLAKLTPTTFDDTALDWIGSALANPTVAEILFNLLFVKRVTPEASDDDLLDALQSLALAAAA